MSEAVYVRNLNLPDEAESFPLAAEVNLTSSDRDALRRAAGDMMVYMANTNDDSDLQGAMLIEVAGQPVAFPYDIDRLVNS